MKRPLENEEIKKPEETHKNTEEIKEPPKTQKILSEPDLTKQKVVFILGYNGSQFFGSMKQKDGSVRTVEGDFEKALIKSNLISKDYNGDLHKILFDRATRTDKKVHALQNFFSCQILINPVIDISEYKEKMQKELPSDIKLFALIKATKRFSTYHCCSSRDYVYYLPSFCMEPLKPDFNYELCTKYRIPKEIIDQINSLCEKYYKGTHKFHNYTQGVKARQGQASRYIMEFKAMRTMEIDGIEFIEFGIKGQSFLYNQIRKMIGMIIHIFRKNLAHEVIANSFQENTFITPLAPGDGLLLKKVNFDKYNKEKSEEFKSIELPETEEKSVNEFLEKLLKDMAQEEIKNKVFVNWLKKLDVSGEGDMEEDISAYRTYNASD